jgi:cell shape-determining protein MreC
MKKRLIMMLGLIMSLQGFSQTDTNNNSTITDTIATDPYEVVCTPKHIMVQVVKDLKDYDLVKEELEAVTEQCALQNTFIEQQDSTLATLTRQNYNLSDMLQTRSDISDNYKLQLDKVARQNEKKKSWIKGLAIALFISFTTNLISN